jgi:hypothetical protein
MSSLKERVRRLEEDLRAEPMRHYIYNDLPFAIFCYPPSQEWLMRKEMKLLKTRLETDGIRQVHFVSLADLLWKAIDESEGMAAIMALERAQGFEAAQRQVQDYLSDPDWRPLPGLLAEKLSDLNPDSDLVFVWRAGALAPNLHRVSTLLDLMKGRTRVPCVLFMPATVDESGGIRFMGVMMTERKGSYHTKVYCD